MIMPILVSGFLLMCALVLIAINLRKNGKIKWLERRSVDIILFLLSSTALFISFGLFINTALYIDIQHAAAGGAHAVTGGRFWTSMLWLELPVLFFLTLISGVRIIRHKK